MSKSLRAAAKNLIVAIAYGDAFGLPFETAEADEGREEWELSEVTQNKYVGYQPAGTWSDDTHLTLATASGLIRARGFDMGTQAAAHVEAYEATLAPSTGELAAAICTTDRANGWGRGTTLAVRKLREGASFTESGSPTSLGNGVLMKMAPLVWWQIAAKVSEGKRAKQIEMFTRMTHNNEASVRAAMNYAEILRALWEGRSVGEARKILSADDLRQLTPKRGFLAEETLDVAVYYFEKEPWFPENVWEAVKYGGDADSICSILGAMSVFNDTYQEPHDVERLVDYDRLAQVGRRLSKMASQ